MPSREYMSELEAIANKVLACDALHYWYSLVTPKAAGSVVHIDTSVVHQ